ncbi:MAG: 7-carboxy-7-deazaguanine synthase QueE [Lewinellaceae bacterium]|nr:7-carboxy-7-deazaguanine synthase QueE [Lewinellaceae bacterium]
MGRPSVFVRCSLCNLHCVWCDTDYTWNWVGTKFTHENDRKPGYRKFDRKKWIADCMIAEVAEAVRQFPCRNVIFTGGEPMLQQEGLTALAQTLRAADAGYRFEVETNGTLCPTPDFDACIDQYNVSPKLENSGNSRRLREKPAAMQFFAASQKANFKFVLSDAADLAEVTALAEKYGIRSEQIWLMPEGTTPGMLSKRRKWLVEICKERGYHYTDRLHIQIWGKKKGV